MGDAAERRHACAHSHRCGAFADGFGLRARSVRQTAASEARNRSQLRRRFCRIWRGRCLMPIPLRAAFCEGLEDTVVHRASLYPSIWWCSIKAPAQEKAIAL